MTLAASKFGPTQGKTAQKWVADSIEAGNLYDDFKTDTLMEMQLTLFAECQLDDDTGKCKDLSEAIDALTSAVAERKNKPKTDECEPRPTLSLHHTPPAPYSPHRRSPPHPPRRVRHTDTPHRRGALQHVTAVDFDIALGAPPIQEAATKLRSAATLFGPEQRSAVHMRHPGAPPEPPPGLPRSHRRKAPPAPELPWICA